MESPTSKSHQISSCCRAKLQTNWWSEAKKCLKTLVFCSPLRLGFARINCFKRPSTAWMIWNVPMRRAPPAKGYAMYFLLTNQWHLSSLDQPGAWYFLYFLWHHPSQSSKPLGLLDFPGSAQGKKGSPQADCSLEIFDQGFLCRKTRKTLEKKLKKSAKVYRSDHHLTKNWVQILDLYQKKFTKLPKERPLESSRVRLLRKSWKLYRELERADVENWRWELLILEFFSEAVLVVYPDHNIWAHIYSVYVN